MNSLEEATIRAFMLPSKRERYVTLLGNPKRRGKARDLLNHFEHFDPRYATELPSTTDVPALLRSRGAPDDCQLISADSDLDGRIMSLDEAIRRIDWGTIVCCVPGRLAFYCGENGEQRLLLERDEKAQPQSLE